MNTTEAKALEWICAHHSLSPKDVKFNGRSSPDFVLPNGFGYEVKRLCLRKNHFVMGRQQLAFLLKRGNCSVLVWRKDAKKPEAIATINDVALNNGIPNRFSMCFSTWG